MRAFVEGEFDSGAEHSVFRWLSELDEPAAVVFNVFAHERKGVDPVQIDAVLWTPHRCAVLEVKGLTEARGGALKATANGAWTLDGDPAPLYGLKSQANAFHQVRKEALALKGALRWRLDRDEFIEGVVVVVPRTGHEMSVEVSEPLEGTRLVIVEGRATVASAVTKLSSGPKRWSASQVVAALRALNLAPGIDEAALLADGFPSEPDPVTPVNKTRRRRPASPAYRGGRRAPRRRVVHAAGTAMPPPRMTGTLEKAGPAAVTARTAVATAPTTFDHDVETPGTEASEWFDPWDLAVSSTDWEPSEPAVDFGKDDVACEQESAQRSWWRPRIRRPGRAHAPSYRSRKVRWYNPFWVLGWVSRWVWSRVRPVVEVVAIFIVGAVVLGGAVYLAGKVVATAFDTTGPQGPLAPVSMMTTDGNIGCVIGTDSRGDFIRCDVANYTYEVPPRPGGCAPEDFGHTVILRSGNAPTYACAQDYLLAGDLPRSESMSSGKYSCTRASAVSITCRERGGQRFTLSGSQFRTW